MSRLATAVASLVALLAACAAFALRGEPAPEGGPPAGAAPVRLASTCPPTPAGQPQVLDISGFAYCPATLTVAAGAEVVWANLDLAPHTVTYDGPGGLVDSGSMAQGQRWAARFDAAGTYAYHCRFHPGMAGTIVVEAGR